MDIQRRTRRFLQPPNAKLPMIADEDGTWCVHPDGFLTGLRSGQAAREDRLPAFLGEATTDACRLMRRHPPSGEPRMAGMITDAGFCLFLESGLVIGWLRDPDTPEHLGDGV